MKPFLTVIIPCRNEVRFLGGCLASVVANDYPPDRLEVLVIDGGSTDGTRELIASYQRRDARVRLVENPQGSTPWALNHGIKAARGEILARVDAHACIAPQYLTRSVEHLLRSGADNVGGVMRTLPQDPGFFAGPIVAALGHRFGVGNSHFRVGCGEPRWVDTVFGGCWRREVFERIGLFNTALERSQDMEFSLRLKAAGGRTLLVPDVASDYFARSRMGPFWRHNWLNGEWAILPFLYSSVLPVAPRHLIPLLFVASLGLALAAVPWTMEPLAVVAIPYGLASAAASAQVARREKRPHYALVMPLVFFVLHLGYGLGSVQGLCKVAAAGRTPRAAGTEETAC
jgi:succinoglycan biosynthesis protein ExoA